MSRHPASATNSVRPVAVLRRRVLEFEAAMLLAADSPKGKPVHRLRTSSRRIEAQIELLALLPGLPNHDREQLRARRALREVRRAAGKVRDSDVQRDLLKRRQAKTGQSRDLAVAGRDEAARLRRHAQGLRRTLKRRRRHARADLQQMLKGRSPKISRRLQQLLDVLAPASELTVSAGEIADLTREWFRRNLPERIDASDPGELHAVRKSAKLARYIAETGAGPHRGSDLPNSGAGSPAEQLSAAFERLQGSGGVWHDLLTLSAISRRELGRHDPLTEALDRECRSALKRFRGELRHTPGAAMREPLP